MIDFLRNEIRVVLDVVPLDILKAIDWSPMWRRLMRDFANINICDAQTFYISFLTIHL